ncbi:hypothetical protein B0A75_15595 [Flavobacterium oncorhynchi]|uniref:Uncharacterized protein n=1 Tax=Flavobacterium oncorhynchi TaxID=728056 RepID=A0A226HVT2_9FLAO|nr:hypothetical protein [Flavobacterium oncorhynchi]OXA98088.1 hypothetical protein B0A75_15595 [Flavobacterium oncorhynchi]
MSDIKLNTIGNELWNGYSKHNEIRAFLINLIQSGITSFIFKYNRIEETMSTTFDFRFYCIENQVEKELFYINCSSTRKTLLSFLEILNHINENYKIDLVNEFANDGYFYDSEKQEIIRLIYP